MSKNWNTDVQLNALNKALVLDKPIFNTFRPLEHQLRAADAILTFSESVNTETFKDKCDRTIVYSDPLGSGKTLVSALVISQYKPAPNCDHNDFRCEYNGFEIQRAIKNPRMSNTSVVVVNSTIIGQWERVFKDTHMSVDVINSADSMISFMTKAASGLPDVILICNDKTSEFKMDERAETEINYMYDVFEKFMRKTCFNIVIYDDFVQTMEGAGKRLSATLSILIESTFNCNFHHYVSTLREFDFWSRKFQQIPNIRHVDGLIEKSFNLPAFRYIEYLIHNPDKKIITAIGAFCDLDVNIVNSMLNSDAISSAADYLGTKATSVNSLFAKLLAEKQDKLKKAQAIIELTKESTKKPAADELSCEDLVKLFERQDRRVLGYAGTDEYAVAVTIIKEKYGRHIKECEFMMERAKESLLSQECEICILEMSECNSMLISKCCNMMLCSDCVRGACKMTAQRNNIHSGTCPKCRATVNITSYVVVSGSFSVDNLAEAAIDKVDFAEKEKKPETPTNERRKHDVALEIFKGADIKERTPSNIKYSNVLKGFENVDLAGGPKKFVIYSEHDEALFKTREVYNAAGVTNFLLKGKGDEMKAIIDQFRNAKEDCAIFINGVHYNSGINLEFATDMILLHYIYDKDRLSQIVGRIQRYGRKFSANIHQLYYIGEK